MNFYSAKVRLAGDVRHEVHRINLSAPEVMVLRAIHGADAVVNIKKTGHWQTSHAGERDRLAMDYGPKIVADLFGPEHRELPLIAPGVSDEVEESDEVKRPDLKQAETVDDMSA